MRSTTSYSTGKYCADIAATSISPNWDVGISTASYVLNVGGGLGVDTNGIGFDPNSTGGNQGIFYNNGVLSSGASPSVTGDVVTICADLGTKLMWVSDTVMWAASQPWNNSASATPATETGGLSFSGTTCPCFLTLNANESGASATMNPTGPLAVTLPAGFSDWQAAASPTTSQGHPMVIIIGG